MTTLVDRVRQILHSHETSLYPNIVAEIVEAVTADLRAELTAEKEYGEHLWNSACEVIEERDREIMDLANEVAILSQEVVDAAAEEVSLVSALARLREEMRDIVIERDLALAEIEQWRKKVDGLEAHVDSYRYHECGE